MGTDILIYLGGLALLDTLSPTIIGVTLYLILTDNENLITRLSSYLITVMILYFSLGIIMILGLDYITDVFSNAFQNRRVLFIIGAILFVGSYFIPINKKNNIPKPKTQGIFSIIIIGIVTFLIEAGIALPYLAAIGMLSTTNIPFYNKLSIIAAYNFIMILPALFILLGYKLYGSRINSKLVNLRKKISANTNKALSWIICIVGVILMLYSIDGLTIRIK
ncbi:GAP family protein [Bacillus sp. BP-3]|uniref:GAP family protein n=1 Tax=Bacillus sp. BP-3 TaxID=3022773 RepID=UPI002330E9A4|nr:GAP family protein [Bacillus sp. BP-3]MDC2867856.1 GAP family protein [Bacillus sp. BP-3]